jgi:hypothetical protein
MIAIRPAFWSNDAKPFWRNDAKRNLVRTLCRRAAYRDDCHARTTNTSRAANPNAIRSAIDRTAARDTTADICTAVSRDARQRQQGHCDWMPSGGARRADRNNRRGEQRVGD